MLEPVTPDTVPVQDLTCDLKGDRYDSFISMRMFCIISAILWIAGFMTGGIFAVCTIFQIVQDIVRCGKSISYHLYSASWSYNTALFAITRLIMGLNSFQKRQGRGQPAAAQGLPAAAHPGQGVRLTHGFFIGRRKNGAVLFDIWAERHR